MKTHCRRQQAFTLVETLVVCGIAAILIALGTPVLTAFKANTVSQGIYRVSDTLEQARTCAMSMNTYVYVGIVQDSNASPAGTMVVGVIASNDSTQIFSGNNANLNQSSASYKPIDKLLRMDNIQTVSLPSNSPTSGSPRQVVPNNYKVGDPTFAQSASSYSFSLGHYQFTSAPGPTSTQGVTSYGMLQIDPQGVVSEVGGGAVPFFEIGLKPVYGNQSNYAAIQIAGLTGVVRIYRP
jgi:Tfp pilus assembly protein FimT